MYTIQNDYLTVTIDKTGATLWSIKDNGGHEYLWQGDPQYWENRAPNLFPYIGRMTEGKYIFDNHVYKMNIHGFIQDMVFEAKQNSEEQIELSVCDTPQTYRQYPFRFHFSVIYKLEKNKLIITYNVKNTDDKKMYFGIGGRPGFHVPMDNETQFEDWYLEFDSVEDAKQVELSDEVLVTGRLLEFPLELGVKLPLKHSLFDKDVIVLTNVSRGVSIKSDKSHRMVKVTYPDMPYVGFWHMPKTDAPYICIEPWSSLPSYEKIVEDLKKQPDLVVLDGGSEYTNRWNIEISF